MANIIVADDEPFLVMVLKDSLEKVGHKVTAASTGAEAIKLIRKKLPDLIILDMTFPDMDGLQIVGALKVDEKTAKIPILMCTGKDTVSDVDASFKLGVVGYIVKPFELERVRKKIDEILSNR
ncbi:MAG: hypothetical protein AUJ85_04430 [Elusimicrobia bacterium CG1_02_37_114]|nr:MAG: hypothetical protein AUJ85_04430 [Elusimicrobia bacterium CG1_02_37_114]